MKFTRRESIAAAIGLAGATKASDAAIAAERAEYEEFVRWAMREDNDEAACNLAVARAWYRANPEAVTSKQPPADFERIAIERNWGPIDATRIELGRFDPNFEKRAHEFARKHFRPHRAS